MKSYLHGLILAFQFFSILPINYEVSMTKENIEGAMRLFPLIGLFFGLSYGGVGYLLYRYSRLSNLLITFVIWLLGIVLTGGIHLDGWMDTADGFFSYREPKDRLEIMADPQVGAFGVISAIVLLVAKFVFIYEVLNTKQLSIFIWICLIPVFSRTVMGWTLAFIPNAKVTGLGHLFQSAKKPQTIQFYLVYLIIMAVILFIINPAFLFYLFIFLFLMTLSFFMIKKQAIQHFGGISGDVIGAITEGMEVFLWLILLVLQSFVML